jgi:glycine/D-amino acid oxidase-like deaminating enzyme
MGAAQRTEVVVLGAGCCGLFLAVELASHGVPCIFIDTKPIGMYSSTRNQGWLQAGTYEACRGLRGVEECSDGFKWITESYPTAVHPSLGSHFLFRFGDQLDEAMRKCQELELPGVTKMMHEDLQALKGSNPLLTECEYGYAMKTKDCSLNSSELLRQAAKEAIEKGATYLQVCRIEAIASVPESCGWRVVVENGRDIYCRALVLACGAFIPTMLRSIIPSAVYENVPVYKIPVLVIRSAERLLTESALMLPEESRSPGIVPFGGYGSGEGGTSVHLGRRKASGPTDELLPAEMIPLFQSSLGSLYPGIHKPAQAGTLQALFYICHRLGWPTKFSYEQEMREHGRVLAFLYSEKLTHSPMLAARFAKDLATDQLGFPWADGKAIGTRGAKRTAPEVATQPYFGSPEYQLTSDGKLLSFRKLARH